MDFADAFGPDIGPEEFFLEKLPRLHEERLDVFGLYSETTLRFCIHLTDVGRRFSVELSPDGARAIEGEFIDFPVVTIEGEEANWGFIRKHAQRMFEKGEEALKAKPPKDRVDRAFLEDLERFDATLTVKLHFEERSEPVMMRAILNDYDPVPGARSIEFSMPMKVADAVLEGSMGKGAARDAIDISGDMSLGFDLSGMMLEHFPELE